MKAFWCSTPAPSPTVPWRPHSFICPLKWYIHSSPSIGRWPLCTWLAVRCKILITWRYSSRLHPCIQSTLLGISRWSSSKTFWDLQIRILKPPDLILERSGNEALDTNDKLCHFALPGHHANTCLEQIAWLHMGPSKVLSTIISELCYSQEACYSLNSELSSSDDCQKRYLNSEEDCLWFPKWHAAKCIEQGECHSASGWARCYGLCLQATFWGWDVPEMTSMSSIQRDHTCSAHGLRFCNVTCKSMNI